MVDRTEGWKEEAQAKRNQARRTVRRVSLPRSIVTHLWQSHTVNTPLKTHPKLWQDAAPAPASFMNVTPRERKMITLQRRQGGGTGGGGRKREEKSLWWIMPLVGQPCNVFGQDSNSPRFSVTAMILFFLPSPFVIPDVRWLWQLRQRWYLMIPLAGTNYYQWLRAETWLLPHMLSLGGGGKVFNCLRQINDGQRCMDPGFLMES